MSAQHTEPAFDPSDLVSRARSGDEDAFKEIVDRYRTRLIFYCSRMAGAMAEDLAQEIFIKFYLALDRFDLSKPVGPFLFRIAHNHCVDALKKKRIRSVSLQGRDDEKGEVQIPDHRPNPEASLQNAELKHAIESALSKVPVRYRSPLVMWHVDGISYAEISEILDLPMGTVKARIFRGRKILQQKLAGFVSFNEEAI